ncbi:methyltransferase domain-containing protein [bacterium]|nr:methyltransferase domain-containing protein [bacterium]
MTHTTGTTTTATPAATGQLAHWSADFGDAYTERNVVAWRDRLAGFRTVLGDLPVSSVLEVGCNRGHNLQALAHLHPDAAIVGIEPNATARAVAAGNGCDARPGDAFALPVADGAFDLVFTAGVLIHVALPDLPRALDEIHRAARRWVLAIEYFADTETSIPYRGRDDLLWKRDFRDHYRRRFADLALVGEGYLDAASGFDRCHWWLFEKPGAGA